MQRVSSQLEPSYSQFAEDREIVRFFGNNYRGTFLDVGANDGIDGSNTYLLETLGWSGMLVEPNAALAEKCRKVRPNSIVVNKAAISSPEIREVEFFEYSGLLPTGQSVDGISSVGSPSHLDQYARDKGATVKRTVVAAASLDAMLADAGISGKIDFVSIDVEGLELEVLKGFRVDKHEPDLILIEDNSFGSDHSLPAYLEKFGYRRMHRTGVNDWYVHPSRAQAFSGRRLRLGWQLAVWSLKRVLRRALFLPPIGSAQRHLPPENSRQP